MGAQNTPSVTLFQRLLPLGRWALHVTAVGGRTPVVTSNISAWRTLGIECVSIGGGCAPRVSGPFRSGFRTCGLRSLSRKRIGSRWLSRRARASLTIRRLSMRFLSKRAPTPSPQSEAGRHLRCRGSGCLYRKAQSGRDRPGRSLRRDRFCHGLPADREPCLGAIDPDLGGTYRRDGDRTTMPRGNVRNASAASRRPT